MKFDIYDGDKTNRFVLGKAGINSFAIFGINPSTADECNSDRTIDKIEKLIKAWNFNGFLMFNLYPFRTPSPENLPSVKDGALIKYNTEKIRKQLQKSQTCLVWAAWGDAFDTQDYFKDCLEEILRETKDLNLEWNRCESFTEAQNPRHPLAGRPHIITEQSQLTKFDAEEYWRRKK